MCNNNLFGLFHFIHKSGEKVYSHFVIFLVQKVLKISISIYLLYCKIQKELNLSKNFTYFKIQTYKSNNKILPILFFTFVISL